MSKRVLCAVIATMLMVRSSPGDELVDLLNLPPPAWGPTELTVMSGRTDTPRPDVVRPTAALMRLIMNWLSNNFELPATDDPPRIEFVPSARMEVLRYRGLASDRQTRAPIEQNDTVPYEEGREVVAIYDDARKTIYLPLGWTGTTPTEVSLLLHEMVHHLQNIGRMKFECPEAREKLAYAAQENWLEMFGLNLESALEIDPFTVLVRGTCKY
jgi:hypothetical protein